MAAGSSAPELFTSIIGKGPYVNNLFNIYLFIFIFIIYIINIFFPWFINISGTFISFTLTKLFNFQLFPFSQPISLLRNYISLCSFIIPFNNKIHISSVIFHGNVIFPATTPQVLWNVTTFLFIHRPYYYFSVFLNSNTSWILRICFFFQVYLLPKVMWGWARLLDRPFLTYSLLLGSVEY